MRRLTYSLSFLVFACRGPQPPTQTPDVHPPFMKDDEPNPEQVLDVEGVHLVVPRQRNGPAPQIQISVKPAPAVGVSRVYSFQPEGTTFDPPVRVTIDASSDQVGSFRRAYLGLRVGDKWERVDNAEALPHLHRMTARLSHFSEYAIISDDSEASGEGARFRTATTELEADHVVEARVYSVTGLSIISLKGAARGKYKLRGLPTNSDQWLSEETPVAEPKPHRADAAGELQFEVATDDATQLFIQAALPSPLYIPRDCDLIGTRNGNSCTLTQDVPSPVYVSGGSLDCAQHRIDADSSGNALIVDPYYANISSCRIGGRVIVQGSSTSPSATIGASQIEGGVYSERSNLSIQASTIAPDADGVSLRASGACFFPVPAWCTPKEVSLFGTALGGDALFPYGLTQSPNAFILSSAHWIDIGTSPLSAERDNLGFYWSTFWVLSFSNGGGTPLRSLSVNANSIVGDGRPYNPGVAFSGCENCTVNDNTFRDRANAIVEGAGVKFERNDIGLGSAVLLGDAGLAPGSTRPLIKENSFSDCAGCLRINGTSAEVVENRFARSERALVLYGHGSPTVSLNDFADVRRPKVESSYAIDLGASGQGNFWGYRCDSSPASFFNTQDAVGNVTDSKAWGVSLISPPMPLGDLLAAGPPGCGTVACYDSRPTNALLFRRQR